MYIVVPSYCCCTHHNVYLRESQMVSGHVSFVIALPAAMERAQSSAFCGSAANILMPGFKVWRYARYMHTKFSVIISLKQQLKELSYMFMYSPYLEKQLLAKNQVDLNNCTTLCWLSQYFLIIYINNDNCFLISTIGIQFYMVKVVVSTWVRSCFLFL